MYPAQELLALRLALEEGCGPGPGPPRELSFTKSSQAVRAVRDALTVACASQWEQLRGLGGDEDELQKLGTEGGCPPGDSPFPRHPAQAPRPRTHSRMEDRNCGLGAGWVTSPEGSHSSVMTSPASSATASGAEGASPAPPSSFRGAEPGGGGTGTEPEDQACG